MKTRLFFVATMLLSTSMFSQTLSDAIKLTNNEQYDNADAAFQKLIQAQPTNGEIYFYYGENYFKNDNAVDHLEMANKIYQKGADVNAKDKNGCTALFYAIEDGYTNFVKALLVKGADVNIVDSSGSTALRHAIARGDYQLRTLLVQAGAK